MKGKSASIKADSILLNVVAEFPQTEKVIRSYDQQAGECICCEMLFEPIDSIARKYHFNLDELLNKLNQAT